MDQYYLEVEYDPDLKPKHRINYCFKCRLTELYLEMSSKFQSLIPTNNELFQTYLIKNSKVSEAKIRDILSKAQIDFKLQTPTYLVHKYDGETVSQDMINGFATKRYDSESEFCFINQIEERVYDHSLSGYHAIGEIVLPHPLPIERIAYSLVYEDKIDLKRYGEDLLDCVLPHKPKCSFSDLKLLLWRSGVKCPYDSLCRLAATDHEILKHVIEVYVLAKMEYPDLWRRNTEIAQNCVYIHPDHKSVGLNILDILILINHAPYITTLDIVALRYIGKENLSFLVKSLKYWLKNVRNENEFDLIRNRVKTLENIGLRIDLLD